MEADFRMSESLRIAVDSLELLNAFKSLVQGMDIKIFVVESNISNLENIDIIFAKDSFFSEIKSVISDESRPSLFVCAQENSDIMPNCYIDGFVDDILVLPARRLEFFSKIRLHHSIKALRQLEYSSAAVPHLVSKLQEDVLLAQKIQRRLIRDKFPSFSGLSIKSKYWCGLKSGGDYFDVFEFPDKNHLGILLVDSSSYALSTSFLSSLMQLSLHFTEEEIKNPSSIVMKLFGSVRDGMKAKDQFSIFYGILDRKTYLLRYVNCGNASLYLQGSKKQWIVDNSTEAMSSLNHQIPATQELLLEAADRLILLSDGWANSINELKEVVEKNAHLESQTLVNEMSYILRKSITADEDDADNDPPMAPEDCSLLILDVAQKILRLAT